MIDFTVFVKPDETALQLYARNYVEPVQTGIHFLPAVLPGQIVEIAGRSGCGKSTFLLQVAINTSNKLLDHVQKIAPFNLLAQQGTELEICNLRQH